jgi:hypothetical protein
MSQLFLIIGAHLLLQSLVLAQTSSNCLKSKLGTDYTGTQNTTASGRTCQAWTSQTPEQHVVYNNADFPDGSAAAANNSCRNPNSDCNGPWCYTTDPTHPIESCGIDMCECLDTPLGTDYMGTMNITATGRVCQAWTSQTPHAHPTLADSSFPDGSAAAALNYCRNPDSNAEGPWCYTRDLDKVRDTCGIPVCVDECGATPNLCGAHGVCNDLNNGYNCTCNPGWTGTNCSTEIDECASGPCLNGGTCMDLLNNYTCVCTPAYNGTNCQTINVPNCVSAVTGNAALQATITQLKQQLAALQSQQANQQCSTLPPPINGTGTGPCTNSSCPNCGTCTSVGNSFTCSCLTGYSGNNCATPSIGGNVALKRPATQSSDFPLSFASLATDGNTNPIWGYYSCSVTNAVPGTNSWWSVDLGQVICVGWVQITNRYDCCPERLSNFNIGTMNTAPSGALLPSQYSLCAYFPGYPPAGSTTTIPCQPGTAPGRYLIVQIPISNYLTMCEVQVYPAGSPPNIALNQPTSQSSTYGTWTAGLAVDGNTNPNAAYGSCSSTNVATGVNSWWSVDLGTTTCVAYVQITQRGDCCPERLSNMNIGLMNTPPSATLLPSQYSLCGYYHDYPALGETVIVPCSTATVPGRYLVIQIPQVNYLSLCEVQVFPCTPTVTQGPATTNLALKRPATQSSDYPLSFASLAVDGNTNPIWGYYSCSVTNYVAGTNSWWSVDLGQPTCVGAVMLTQRWDCCPTRLANFDIGLMNTAPAGSVISSQYSLCAHYTGYPPAGATVTVPCQTSTKQGRYLVIVDAITDYLTICEVQVYACGSKFPLQNIALNQPATQSSTYGTWTAGLSVDGNTNPNAGLNSCASTNVVAGVNSWWSVDLGNTTCVSSVTITQRADCCPERLANMNIGLMNTPPSQSLAPSQYSLCAYYPDYPALGETVNLPCMPGTLPGRYLVVQIPSVNYLSTCEVQVFGC